MKNEVLSVKLEGLNVGYKGKNIVKKINLDITKGEIVVLIGPNGSGKSTVLKSIIKQLKTIEGGIYIQGRKLEDYTQGNLAKQVSVMLTDKITTDIMTVRDVVEMGRYPYTGRFGVLSKEDKAIVEEAMKAVEIQKLSNFNFNELSDGQKQRVLLARAICQKTDILVLDEPTSYLDIKHKMALLNVLKKLARKENKAIIVSLHEVDLAQKIADKLVCIKDQKASVSENQIGENINEIFELEDKNGFFDPIFSSLEFPKVPGEPKVMVLSSGGSGIPIYRKLQKDGIPFHGGVLFENDLDYHLAKRIAANVISVAAFHEISDYEVALAQKIVNEVDEVFLTNLTFGPSNEKMKLIINYARKCNKLVEIH